MSVLPQPRLTPEQYLEIDRVSQFRNEFYSGRMYAMSGGSHRHALIIGNISGELRQALKKRPCRVTPSDLRVRVDPAGLYTYPDVVVVCGEPSYADDHIDTLLNPVFVAEVLSPSTEAYDRGFKSAQYRRVESLQEFVVIAQAEARVEVFRRQPGGQWLFAEFVGLDSVCRFDSLDISVSMADIYDKVAFDAEPTLRADA
jgi:Uma2 family endonuclease